MNKKYLESFIKEIIPVVIGILIALYINNWNEQRKDKKYINHILNSIKSELTETKNDISKNIESQQTVLDTINFYKQNADLSIYDVFRKVDGFRAPNIRISSWNAISNNKIELIDYKQLSKLNNIEKGKELLEGKLLYLQNFMYSNMNDTSENKKRTVILLIQDIISTENSIKQEIEDFKD